MYKCVSCGKVIGPMERQNKRIVLTRDKVYNYENKDGFPASSHGTEIVKEESFCKVCAAEFDIVRLGNKERSSN